MSAFDILNRFFKLPIPDSPSTTYIRVSQKNNQNVAKVKHLYDIEDILGDDEMAGLVKIKQRVIRKNDVIKVVTYYRME